MILIALSCVHLGGQGPQYDELHQAPAAFEYLGRHSPTFNYGFHGLPILNMTYSGAIKSNIYGLYLRFVNPHFTLISWRLFGIGFLALGLFGFYQIVGPSISAWSSLVFGLMLLTDVTVVLLNRHDMGPVSLALCLRLMFIALWISVMFRGAARWKYFLLGFIVGVAIFEKLSSLVLLLPLVLFLFACGKYLRRSWLLAGFGLLAGVLPLLVLNAATFVHGHGFISLTGVGEGSEQMPLTEHFTQVLQLGQGDQARRWILGDTANPLFLRPEEVILLVLLTTVVIAALRLRSNREFALAGQLVFCYAVVSVGVFLLPKTTFVHHWILNTPFHYGAIALALGAAIRQAEQRQTESRVYRWILLASLIALIAIRIPSVWNLETSLAAGRAADNWNPAFARLAELAASRATDSAFLAADWGTATQVYCFGNGQEDLVYEPFWGLDPGKATGDIARATKKDNLYTLVTGIAPEFKQASSSILLSMASLPEWQEVPVEQDFKGLSPVQIRKFTRRSKQ